MSKKKYSYFVGVIDSKGRLKFVTSLNYANKYARWTDGEKALEMSMAVADDIVFGLLMNFHYAFTVKVPHGIEFTNPVFEESEVQEDDL